MCAGCNEPVEIWEVEIPFGPLKGQKVETKQGCKCMELEIARRTEADRKAAIQRRTQRIFNENSIISPKLQQATFENFIPENKSQQEALAMCLKYVDDFDKNPGSGLFFTGLYGIGKSHLAKSITDKIMAKGYNCIFISVPQLLTKFKSTYDKKSELNESDLFQILNTVDLLVMDDLGAERATDWAQELLFEIIDHRQGKHTIYTTNLTPQELMTRLGERNFSRVVNEDAELILLEGVNHRLKKFLK